MNVAAFRREMRSRGRRMYWRYKLTQFMSVVGIVLGVAILIAALYGFMLILPD